MSGSPPDMELTAYDKDRQSGAKVGVAWTRDDGSIGIVLNPGCALIYNPSIAYTLKPMMKATETRPAYGTFKPERTGNFPAPRPPAAKPRSRGPSGYEDFDDQDIPF